MKTQTEKEKPVTSDASSSQRVNTVCDPWVVFSSRGLSVSCHFPYLTLVILFFKKKNFIPHHIPVQFLLGGQKKNQSDKLMNASKLRMGAWWSLSWVFALWRRAWEYKAAQSQVEIMLSQYCHFYHFGRSEKRQQTSYCQQGNLSKVVSQK